jgi:hypothetical protein
VELRQDLVPPDLRADVFLQKLIENVLERTPIDLHVGARERRERLEPSGPAPLPPGA